MGLGKGSNVGYPDHFHGWSPEYRQDMPSIEIQRLRQRFPVRAMPATAVTPIVPGPRPSLVGVAQVLDVGPKAPMLANATKGATTETLAGSVGG